MIPYVGMKMKNKAQSEKEAVVCWRDSSDSRGNLQVQTKNESTWKRPTRATFTRAKEPSRFGKECVQVLKSYDSCKEYS